MHDNNLLISVKGGESKYPSCSGRELNDQALPHYDTSSKDRL